jgi:hypothetical protein
MSNQEVIQCLSIVFWLLIVLSKEAFEQGKNYGCSKLTTHEQASVNATLSASIGFALWTQSPKTQKSRKNRVDAGR